MQLYDAIIEFQHSPIREIENVYAFVLSLGCAAVKDNNRVDRQACALVKSRKVKKDALLKLSDVGDVALPFN